MSNITIVLMNGGLTYGLVPWLSLLCAQFEGTPGLRVCRTGSA